MENKEIKLPVEFKHPYWEEPTDFQCFCITCHNWTTDRRFLQWDDAKKGMKFTCEHCEQKYEITENFLNSGADMDDDFQNFIAKELPELVPDDGYAGIEWAINVKKI